MKKWASKMMALTMIATLFVTGESYALQGDDTRVLKPQNIPTVGRTEDQQGAVIVFREKEKDSWVKDGEFVFMLPDGVTWATGTKVNGEEPFARDRKLTIYFHGTRDLDQIVLTPVLHVRRDVPLGDIDLSINNGPISPENGRIVIAKVSDHGLLINAQDTQKIIYGDKSAKKIKVKLDEMIDESLLRSMPYELTLENATFVKKTAPSVRTLTGNKKLEAKYTDDSLVLMTNDQAKKTSWEIGFEIVPNADYVGDIVLNLKGRETDQKTVVASVDKDLNVVAGEMKNVSLGYRNQAVADLTITEAKDGLLSKGTYVLSIDPVHEGNMIESAAVEVTDGNLSIANVRHKNNEITFDITRESTRPSTIVVKDVQMSMSGAAYLGEYKVKLAKSGKEMTNFAELLWFNATAPTDDPSKPAPARVAQFVIDKTDYTLFLKGVKEEKSFDVAPFIESGRTMMSVKAVAEALDMDVAYDAATKTVSITSKGEKPKTVKMTIGEKNILVDEKPVPIDVAPMIKDGRTFVPVSYVGKFFDVKTAWDGELKMITVTVD